MDYLAKCADLWRLYEGSTTPHEAATVWGRIMHLINTHRLDITIADLEAGLVSQPAIVADEESPLYTWRLRDDTWRQGLVLALCNHFGVVEWKHMVRVAGGGRRKRFVGACFLCGRPDDVAHVRELYALVSDAAVRLWSLSGLSGRSQKCSWMRGFVYGVNSQLKLSKLQAIEAASSSAILSKAMVLLDQRLAKSKEALEQRFPELKNERVRLPERKEPEAFFAGRLAGKELHLGRSLPPTDTSATKACCFCGSTNTKPPGGGLREHHCESCGAFFC